MQKVVAFFLLCCMAAPSLAVQPGLSQKATATGNHVKQYTAARDINIQNYGQDRHQMLDVIGSKVAITSAYLVPSLGFADQRLKGADGVSPDPLRDAAFLCVEVANIRSQPLLVTAMKLEILNPGGMRFGPTAWGAGCPGERVASVTPECLLQPGEKKKWLLSKGMVIPGVVDFINQQRDEFIFDDFRPRLTNNDDVIDRFNAFLRAHVGAKTTLKVSIFELDYKPVLVGYFQLSKGSDMFVSEPSVQKINGKTLTVYPLQHDSFLGEAISQAKADGKQVMPGLACHSAARAE